MSLYKQFRTDATVEREGLWLNYGPNDDLPEIGKNADGTSIYPEKRILIARAGGANDAFSKRLEAKGKPHRRQIQHETIDPKLLLTIVKEVYAETVVLGWENVTDENGVVMSFNKENCIKVFNDLPDLFIDLKEQAERSALFRVHVREEDAKN